MIWPRRSVKLHGKPKPVLKETSNTPTTSPYINSQHKVLTTHITSIIKQNYSKQLALTRGTANCTHDISNKFCCYCYKLILGRCQMKQQRSAEQEQEARNNLIMATSSPSVRTIAEDWLQAVHRSPSADTCKSHTTELPYNTQTFDYVLWLI